MSSFIRTLALFATLASATPMARNPLLSRRTSVDYNGTAFASASEVKANEQICQPGNWRLTDDDYVVLVSADFFHSGKIVCGNHLMLPAAHPTYELVTPVNIAGWTEEVEGTDFIVSTTLMGLMTYDVETEEFELEYTAVS